MGVGRGWLPQAFLFKFSHVGHQRLNASRGMAL